MWFFFARDIFLGCGYFLTCFFFMRAFFFLRAIFFFYVIFFIFSGMRLFSCVRIFSGIRFFHAHDFFSYAIILSCAIFFRVRYFSRVWFLSLMRLFFEFFYGMWLFSLREEGLAINLVILDHNDYIKIYIIHLSMFTKCTYVLHFVNVWLIRLSGKLKGYMASTQSHLSTQK